MGGKLTSVHPGEGQVADGAGLCGVETGKDSRAGTRLDAPGPAILQESKPGRFPLAADGLVKLQGFRNGVVSGGRVGPNLLELADVVGQLLGWPESAARSS